MQCKKSHFSLSSDLIGGFLADADGFEYEGTCIWSSDCERTGFRGIPTEVCNSHAGRVQEVSAGVMWGVHVGAEPECAVCWMSPECREAVHADEPMCISNAGSSCDYGQWSTNCVRWEDSNTCGHLHPPSQSQYSAQ